MTVDVPSEFVPDEHIVLEADGGERFDLEITPLDGRRGVSVGGIAPPFYTPAVVDLGGDVYRIEQPGNPTERVNLRTRTCSCRDYQERGVWCFHLDLATLCKHRRPCRSGGEA